MYCRKCGKQIEDDSKYCKYCGALLGNPNSSKGLNAQPKVSLRDMYKALSKKEKVAFWPCSIWFLGWLVYFIIGLIDCSLSLDFEDFCIFNTIAAVPPLIVIAVFYFKGLQQSKKFKSNSKPDLGYKVND